MPLEVFVEDAAHELRFADAEVLGAGLDLFVHGRRQRVALLHEGGAIIGPHGR